MGPERPPADPRARLRTRTGPGLGVPALRPRTARARPEPARAEPGLDPLRPGGCRMKALAALPGELLAVMHGSTPNHLHLRQRLVTLVASVLVIDAVASVLAWRLERNLPRSDIHHYGDALFWTT